MGKYFGTDGFRGEAGITLTADYAYKVGRFLGWYYNALRERNGNNEPARIVIGKDTRRSSYMFEYSLVAGLTASGADAYLLHVTTTPSVAYIARVDDFDCGIMISASHNPFYDNGIKLIDCYGEKMPEEILLLVEDYIDGKLHVFDKDWPELPFAHREHIGCTVDYVSVRITCDISAIGSAVTINSLIGSACTTKCSATIQAASSRRLFPSRLFRISCRSFHHSHDRADRFFHRSLSANFLPI